MGIICRIELLGRLRVTCGEQAITHFETRKTAALLAFLAFHRQQCHTREMLAEQLWPEEDEVSRARLRQALSALRQNLPPDVLLTDRTEIRLNLHVVTTDVEEFETALRDAEQAASAEERRVAYRQAIALYHGELLPGFYEDWMLVERDRLEERFRETLRLLARSAAETGDLDEAIRHAQQAVVADPLREDIHADLMRYYLAAGRRADALKQYRELEEVLWKELQIVPSSATHVLHQQLQQDARQLPSTHAVVSSETLCPSARPALEAEGGSVPPMSSFYLLRAADAAFAQAAARGDSIVLVKGARQMGKTSLLGRGLQQARETGVRVVLTDLRKLTAAQMENADALFFSIAEIIAEQLDLNISLDTVWNVRRGWNVNFERFLRREVLAKTDAPLIWAIDEVDRLFAHSYRGDVFGLFRAWHNERSLDPAAPWSKMTLALAYATEAHLFLTDLNQSPFNVGTRLTLADFTPDEVEEMNRRYGSPLLGKTELQRFYALVGGHPYLVRRGLRALVEQEWEPDTMENAGKQELGALSDHLRRMLACLRQDACLCDAVRALLQGAPFPDAESFYRLHSAGIIVGDTPKNARLRCNLYRDYLAAHLLPETVP
jgi:DNA-binding SARP family transcriptional activator